MAVLYSTGLVLWILCQIGSRPCFAQCKEPNAFLCDIGVVNMTSDGGAKIRNAIDSQDFMYAVGIEKLIVSSSASGPFLQRIAPFTETIIYLIYRDPVFQVPAGNTIAEIEISNAANLRSVVAGTNRHLKRLQLENCQLDRVPPTLSQMIELEELIIASCAMTALRLDVLVNNPKLNILSLWSNQIRQLFPITSPPKQGLTLAIIDLSNNQLERLDMSFFVHMPDLERLNIQANRIVRIEATAPVTYASLLRLDVKSNKISSLDTRNLTLPSLTSFYVDDNALTEIPTRWGSLPKLHYVGFDRNNLKQIDMSAFGQFQNLTQIYISENNIQTIRTSSPITLPKLDMIVFENNRIASVNFTGCNFPELNLISLMNNLLTTVPPLFQRFPKTRMSVEWNPIKCSNLLSLKTKIEENRLFVITGTTQSRCSTTSSIVLNQETSACCEA
ncbi:leucine-rich repeat protein SHOC-2-like [Anopheles moucheti]|uniref:leucine-rich repeat protein SHOC-2-like n=1 Tax=Anopheles moucheti TaxID=186751 RepID=UPI0022F081C6|nr:leucine-rich repeat protein SHOC-2-like [Anopheles moucheti]